MKNVSLLIILLTVLSGCATNVKFLDQSDKQEQLVGDTVSIFIDANGSFYPKNGFDTNMQNLFDKNFSILNLATHKDLQCGSVPTNTEMHTLCQVKNHEQHYQFQQDFIKSRAKHLYRQLGTNKHLVVFIHGYNNNFEEATDNFELLKEKVLESTKDQNREFVFLNIYWDGFKGNPVSGAWRKAQASGPLVGYRLRAFFNALIDQFENERKPSATFVTHSSGAFVLGALFGNPTVALPLLKDPDGDKDWVSFRKNRSGNVDLAYAIPSFASIRLGMIAAATPTTTFNSTDNSDKKEPRTGGILADNVYMLLSMNKYDFALTKVFQLQNFNFTGATGSGSDKELFCDELEKLSKRDNVTKVQAIHFEKPDTPWYWPINNHSLSNNGYLYRQEATKLFFDTLMNEKDSIKNKLFVDCG